jgi:hypothetical protein
MGSTWGRKWGQSGGGWGVVRGTFFAKKMSIFFVNPELGNGVNLGGWGFRSRPFNTVCVYLC